MTSDLKNSLLYIQRSSLYILFAVTAAICIGVMFQYAPEQWSIFRKIAGGVIGGMWVFLCIFANRILIA